MPWSGLVSYVDLLEQYPIVTKSITTGLLMTIGDLLAQWMCRMTYYGRVAWVGLVGACVSGPGLHYWFLLLSQLFPAHGTPTVGRILLIVALDQTIGTIAFNCAFLFLMGLFEGLNDSMGVVRPPPAAGWFGITRHYLRWAVGKGPTKVRSDIWIAVWTGWKMWPISQFINFKWIPEPHRVLFASALSVVWCTLLSRLITAAPAKPPPGPGESWRVAERLITTISRLIGFLVDPPTAGFGHKAQLYPLYPCTLVPHEHSTDRNENGLLTSLMLDEPFLSDDGELDGKPTTPVGQSSNRGSSPTVRSSGTSCSSNVFSKSTLVGAKERRGGRVLPV